MKCKEVKHPLQPLVVVKTVLRFKENAIVSHLLNVASRHGHDLNALAMMKFSLDDWRQFNQLIGYSYDGIPNMDQESLAAALEMHEGRKSELQARYDHVSGELEAIRKALKKPIARLYDVHPDNLDYRQ
jgi:hypothetical protein